MRSRTLARYRVSRQRSSCRLGEAYRVCLAHNACIIDRKLPSYTHCRARGLRLQRLSVRRSNTLSSIGGITVLVVNGYGLLRTSRRLPPLTQFQLWIPPFALQLPAFLLLLMLLLLSLLLPCARHKVARAILLCSGRARGIAARLRLQFLDRSPQPLLSLRLIGARGRHPACWRSCSCSTHLTTVGEEQLSTRRPPIPVS